MELSEGEKVIQKRAIEWAKKVKNDIGKKLTDRSVYQVEDSPVSVFMAGSPGAGKTEAAKSLLAVHDSIIRLDIDDMRQYFDDYNGGNAYLFQGAASILLDRAHDLALKQKQSFLLDGTMADFNIAKKNIERSLKRGRTVQILFVYQQPQQAWRFVQAREKVEGRRVFPEKFVDQYFLSRESANLLKRVFGDKIILDLLIKNIDGTNQKYHRNITQLDGNIKDKYSRGDLLGVVGLSH
ncbi:MULTISPECIES: zeta toxin family protein [unclassified Endozoicomonas]|uniref:zeta toxin family protein n=1 Tax=unclassified Endozoicomonas TaxID=2644528 RepID=UPI003BB7410E